MQQEPRRCRIVCGDRERAIAALEEALRAHAACRCLWFGDPAPPGVETVTPERLGRVLGSECDLLVYDVHTGLLPDLLAALLGCLRGGGLLVLIAPEWSEWPSLDDPALLRIAPWPLGVDSVGRRFVRRMQRLLEAAGDTVRRVPPASAGAALPSAPEPPAGPPALLPEQRAVVEALCRTALGHARRPLVVTADRGRGKTTALGAGLAALLREAPRRVCVLAPSRQAVAPLFDRLQRELPGGSGGDGGFTFGEGCVLYRAPAAWLAERPACDLLVVDEAAALGVPLLERLLEAHNRLVFCTTVHGYEGSGRGFLLRFRERLDRRFRQWRWLRLETPVRWAAGDPLEALARRLFLLDAEAGTPPADGTPVFHWLDRAGLARDEALLERVFGLLVEAHYQTRPSDLQLLLDAPGAHLLVAAVGRVPIGVALLVEEGGLDPALADAVCAGRRRPRGHALLQSLAAHGGWCRAPVLRLFRVMRIAVAAAWRRRGVGSRLLERAREHARLSGADLLGTGFGLTPGLLAFWQRNGYQAVRVGHRIDPASAAHSAQLLLPLSEAGHALVTRAADGFRADLPWRLLSGLRDLPSAAVIQLLRGRDCGDLPVDDKTLSDVRHFAFGHRRFEDALPALRRWSLCQLAAGGIGGASAGRLVRHVLQQHPVDGDAVACLRRAIRQWLAGD